MNALVTTELLKLRSTRTAAVLSGLFLVLVAAGLVLVTRRAGHLGAPSVGTADHTVAFLGAGAGTSLLLLVSGVITVTSEHRHGTLTGTLLVSPHRGRVLAAKAVAIALVGAGAAVVALGLAVAAGAATGGLGQLALNGELVASVAGRLAVLPLYGLLGVGIGALVRHQTAAVVIPLLWFLVVETLVPAYGLGGLVPWLPGGAAAALGHDAAITGLLPWAGGLLLAGYAAVLGLAGARRLRRADVT